LGGGCVFEKLKEWLGLKKKQENQENQQREVEQQ